MEETTFSNMDTWKSGGSKFGLDFRGILLEHIRRCVKLGSLEFRGGYYDEKIRSVGGTSFLEKIYVPDSRDMYINAISQLENLLLGYYDEKMNEAKKEIDEEKEKLEESFESIKDEKELQEYYRRKIKIFIVLFQQLVMLTKRLNFLEEMSGEEEEL